MTVEEFFNLLLEELKQSPQLKGYYRFLNDPSFFYFRKAYFCQRLQYIFDQIPKDKNVKIFDIGCGYGTTAIFLVLNGYSVTGGTLEYYFEQINTRKIYWSKHGSLNNLEIKYENFYDNPLLKNTYNIVIAQDVLHHLEPIDEALKIISESLVSGGKLIACEENGNNVLNRIRLFLKRGNKKIIEFNDDKLGKKILMGNENIRNQKKWTSKISDAGLCMDEKSIQYIRLFFPRKYRRKDNAEIIKREQQIWPKNSFAKNFLFHGLNFVAVKTT
jgi:2-polyprenyl-3-methyl-5-hydroxy-6-metoxy-1,4-benzoquinol methylase